MANPLKDFRWSSLYLYYDLKCVRFDRENVHLKFEELKSPVTDRRLYYSLADLMSDGRSQTLKNRVATYKAMLYWKFYSTNPTFYRWFKEGSAANDALDGKLKQLFETLPTSLGRNVTEIINLVRYLDEFSIPGIENKCALPARTTLLHFLYPSSVPIFDKMVLRAVGMWTDGANRREEVLREYIPVAWRLCEQYNSELSHFKLENPLRALDMALWVGRGQ